MKKIIYLFLIVSLFFLFGCKVQNDEEKFIGKWQSRDYRERGAMTMMFDFRASNTCVIALDAYDTKISDTLKVENSCTWRVLENKRILVETDGRTIVMDYSFPSPSQVILIIDSSAIKFDRLQ